MSLAKAVFLSKCWFVETKMFSEKYSNLASPSQEGTWTIGQISIQNLCEFLPACCESISAGAAVWRYPPVSRDRAHVGWTHGAPKTRAPPLAKSSFQLHIQQPVSAAPAVGLSHMPRLWELWGWSLPARLAGGWEDKEWDCDLVSFSLTHIFRAFLSVYMLPKALQPVIQWKRNLSGQL